MHRYYRLCEPVKTQLNFFTGSPNWAKTSLFIAQSIPKDRVQLRVKAAISYELLGKRLCSDYILLVIMQNAGGIVGLS